MLCSVTEFGGQEREHAGAALLTAALLAVRPGGVVAWVILRDGHGCRCKEKNRDESTA